MRSSASAYLVFGIRLEPEEYKDVLNNKDWDRVYAEKKGLPYPTDKYDGNEKLYSEYWKNKKKIIDETPCKINTFGYIDNDIEGKTLVAYVKEFKAFDFGNEEIAPVALKVQDTDFLALKDFCDTMGIKYREPKWYLCADYG